MAERSADWTKQARRDLEGARWAARGGFHEWACFLAQQSAEKALKAVYQKLGGEAWGHSVVGLLVGLASQPPAKEDVASAARLLDRFYIPARYPNGWDQGCPKDYFRESDAEDAFGAAETVLRFCDGLLA